MYRSRIWSAWSARASTRGVGSSVLFWPLGVDGDLGTVLGDRDDRDRDLAGDPLGGAVAGAGLGGGDVGIGDQVDVGAHEARAVAVTMIAPSIFASS